MVEPEKKMNGYIQEVFERKSVSRNLGWLKENLLPVKVIYTDLDGTMVGPMGCFFRDRESNLTLRPAKALLDQIRQVAAVVDVGMREDHSFKGLWIKLKIQVVVICFLTFPLEQTADAFELAAGYRDGVLRTVIDLTTG